MPMRGWRGRGCPRALSARCGRVVAPSLPARAVAVAIQVLPVERNSADRRIPSAHDLALEPVRSWNTKPSSFKENTNAMSSVAAYSRPCCIPSPTLCALSFASMSTSEMLGLKYSRRRRWCGARSSTSPAKLRRILHRFTRRQVENHAVGRCYAGADRCGEIAWRCAFRHHPTQNIPRFFLHRAAVHGRADAQALLDVIFKVANRDAGYRGDRRTGS